MITGDSYIGSHRQHRLSDQVSANTYEPADKQDQDEYPTGIALCLSPREIDQPLQGADSSAHTASRTREHSGADTAGQSRRAWLGPPLQAGPRQKALPPARRMAGAADLVASVPQVALLRLENVATQ